MYRSLQPRKEKPVKPPPSAPVPTPATRDVRGKLSQVAAFRALLEISPGAMQRVASSPNFLITQQQNARGKDGSDSEAFEASRAGSQEADWLQDQDLLAFLNELEEAGGGSLGNSSGVNDIVEDIMNDLVEKLTDAKSKKMGNAILTFSNTVLHHDIFKRVMTDDIPFRLESALDTLLASVIRARGAKSATSVKDGIGSLKVILFFVVCLRPSLIESSVSGSMLESITETLLNIVLPPKKVAASHPTLTWLSWLLLGLLLRNQLTHDLAQNDPPVSWVDLFGEHSRELLERKRKQLDVLTDQSTEVAKGLTWTTAEVMNIDGFCLCMAIYLTNFPTTTFRDREPGSQVHFLWTFVFQLGTLCDTAATGPLEFVNAYANALGLDIARSRGGNHLFGLAHLLGIMYEGWWSFFNERDRETSPLEECDWVLLRLVNGFDGKLEAASVKALTKSVTKEMATIFREAGATMEKDAEPKAYALQIQRNDVLDTLASHAAQFESDEATSLIGASIVARKWAQLLMMRCCKAAAANHSTLALAIEGENSGILEEKREEGVEEKNQRMFRQQISHKLTKQSRQGERNMKESRQCFYSED